MPALDARGTADENAWREGAAICRGRDRWTVGAGLEETTRSKLDVSESPSVSVAVRETEDSESDEAEGVPVKDNVTLLKVTHSGSPVVL